MPRVVLNGEPVELPDARSLADALAAAGVRLPALCHDDRLAPSGNCRLCLVRIKGFSRPVPACATDVVDGMEIETSSPDLEASRHGLLGLLAARYPATAVEAAPDKPFHQELIARNVGREQFRPDAPDPALIDRSHPYIDVDMNRCIDCLRCVRICAEVQGQFVWHVRDRGTGVRVVPDGPSLLTSSCVSCGACVDTCPTGALEDASVERLGVADSWTRSVCPYCGTGCEISVGTREGTIVSIKPVRHSPVSKGHLCVKGRYAFEFVTAGDRVTEPMIREGNTWRCVSWDDALSFTASRLRAVIERHGPDAVGVLASARQTNEENYLTQKFARTVIGSNNVDCCARVCHAPSSTALKRSLGAGLSTNSFDDIEHAGLILVCGANPTENHPIVGARIKQAVRRHGATLVVIDPRRIELAAYSDVFLRVHPGANVPLLNAMAHVIVREHLVDRTFVDERVEGYSAFAEFIREWPPERVADVCGVEPDDIRRAARLYATTRPAMIVNGLGVTEHVQGTDGESALINLALLTGNFGKPGTGVNPLRGQNNVQGAAHMGCEPQTLPGGIPLEQGRHAFEQLWRTPLPRAQGLHQLQMLNHAATQHLRALWTIGYDLLVSNPNASMTADALSALDFVIIQDLFMTETARRFGSVFLPACSSFEKDGTFMNAERRIQRVRQALPPIGSSKSDWQIICALATAMEHADGFGFSSAEDIWNEVRQACTGARGMSYARLDREGLQWPCPDEGHPGTPILHVERWSAGVRAPLLCVDFNATPEQPTPKYPFILNTGRTLYAFNAATMTGRGRTRELRPSDLLDISPDDASAADLHDGDSVRVVSRYGEAAILVRVNASIRPGELFATFHSTDVLLNALTGPRSDEVTGTPEYKVTAVRLEKC
jgi:formate dehydrogenase major subunit